MVDTGKALERLRTLRTNRIQFAAECLEIRTKAGRFEKLIFNKAQMEVDRLLDQQRDEKGWVRALILKGRQQGISTYIAARFYHSTSLNRGRNTYILTHEQTATDTLFGMVDRYQLNNPLGPHVGRSNAKELEFDRLDSSYAVATAGQKAGGRGKALFNFHGSEVAFWANAPDHFSASVQGVPLVRDTEVILESTSAGAGGEFYERCQDAEQGVGDYQLIFLPWWYSSEYARDVEPGFMLSKEEIDGEISEQEYQDIYELGSRQMAWRRGKIQELRDPLLFRREYPATVNDAWTAPPGHEPYIGSLLVLRARKRNMGPTYGPLILGVDPASGGGDRFAIAARRGNKVEWVVYRNKLNHEEAVAWVSLMIDQHKPARVNIDAGNIGANVVTSLKNKNAHYANIVRGVNFGGTSEWRLARPKVPGPYNRRAEMYQRFLGWLELPEGVSIPDQSALQSDICSPKQVQRLDNYFQLESKVDLKKRGVRSGDLADAVVLTFAFNEFITTYHQPNEERQYGDIDRPGPRVVEDESPSYADEGGGANSWMY